MIIDPILGLKLIFVFGVTNILSLALVFFSCRCMVGIKFVNWMFKYDWYRKYYYKHCYYWWIFIISVIIHATLAFIIFGIPL